MNERELAFVNEHRESTGHTMISQPAIFRFSLDGMRHSFTPDFYCPDCETFYEVAGTRQAFHQDKFKLKAMKIYYPSIKMEVVNPSGVQYKTHPSELYLNYRNGKILPAVKYSRKDISMRMDAVERLTLFVGESPNLIDDMSKAIGCRHGVGQYLNGHRIPNSKTARSIHEFLNATEKNTET